MKKTGDWKKSILGCSALTLFLLSVPPLVLATEGGHTPDDGHGTVVSTTLAGPDGVAQGLESAEHQEMTSEDTLLPLSWFEWKEQLKTSHGFSFGAYAYLLYQNASGTMGDDNQGMGGIFRLQGSWVLLGRNSGHPGRLEWRIENRSALGGYLAPSSLSGQAGIAALNTGFGYSDTFDTDLSVFNWTQLFNDETAGVAVGRLAFDVYLDAFAFQTFSRGFLNRAFVVNPTMGTTGIGSLGAVAKGMVSDQFLLGVHIYDGNAASGDFDIDTFNEHEWLKAVEIAWTPSKERYKTDRIQFTYWDKDEREQAGVSRGSGWVVSASWQVNEKLLPFTRFGHSDGGAGVPAESAAAIGFEYTPLKDHTWSLGSAWAKPIRKTGQPDPDDEYVVETSYTVQIWPFMSLTPNVQLLLDPANNPDESSIWVFSLRTILKL